MTLSLAGIGTNGRLENVLQFRAAVCTMNLPNRPRSDLYRTLLLILLICYTTIMYSVYEIDI